jgi:hypothetical protein
VFATRAEWRVDAEGISVSMADVDSMSTVIGGGRVRAISDGSKSSSEWVGAGEGREAAEKEFDWAAEEVLEAGWVALAMMGEDGAETAETVDEEDGDGEEDNVAVRDDWVVVEEEDESPVAVGMVMPAGRPWPASALTMASQPRSSERILSLSSSFSRS